MNRRNRRTPKGYRGIEKPYRESSQVLGGVLEEIGIRHQGEGLLILQTWPEILGGALAGMTQAEGFRDGILYIRVKSSTLLSLLKQQEKPRLLACLRERFPQSKIRTIVFRIA